MITRLENPCKKEEIEKIVKEIEKIHSYKIPCIIKIPVKANGKYDKWIKNNII